jgi:hypothetical protein
MHEVSFGAGLIEKGSARDNPLAAALRGPAARGGDFARLSREG